MKTAVRGMRKSGGIQNSRLNEEQGFKEIISRVFKFDIVFKERKMMRSSIDASAPTDGSSEGIAKK